MARRLVVASMQSIERPIDLPPPPDGGSVTTEGQMSASTRTVQGQIGYGGYKSALVALALVVIMAATVAFVALSASRTATVAPAAAPVPAPAYLDRGSRGEVLIPAIPFVDRDKGLMDYSGNTIVEGAQGNFGGWGGPRLDKPSTGSGGHNGTRFAQ
jgi:hypothetical protein